MDPELAIGDLGAEIGPHQHLPNLFSRKLCEKRHESEQATV